MDPNTSKSQPLLHSFDLNEEPRVSTISGRKRKLQYDKDSVVPLSKYKFRDRFYDSDDDSLVEDVIIPEDHPDVGVGISNGPNNYPTECDNLDRFVGSSRGSNRPSMHNSDKMVMDAGSRVTTSFDGESNCDHPSTSSGSCSNNCFGMDGNSRNKSIIEQDNFELEDEEDESQSMELKNYKESLYEFEAFSNLLSTEIASNVIDKCIGGGSDDSSHHSNGLTWNSHARSLSDKPAAQKATIDREFEQYFSSLMLDEM